MVSMLTANISGAALIKQLTIQMNVVSEKWKPYFTCGLNERLDTFLKYLKMSLTRTVMVAPFLFVLQDSGVMKEHHCQFVYVDL